MTNYIKFPTAPNIDLNQFRADYLSITGEKIQENPLENEQGTYWLVGSSRIGKAEFNQIKALYPSVTMTDKVPNGWVSKTLITK